MASDNSGASAPGPDDITKELQEFLDSVRSGAGRSPKKALPRYDEHVVCFMDLLGFRQLVTSMGVSEARREIAELERILDSVVEPYRDPEEEPGADPEGIRVNYFSDCMCLSMSLRTRSAKNYLDRIFWLLVHVLHVQGELAWNGRLVRGGVVIDRHYSSDRLIFSPAQIRAYDIESRRATFPRVVVDDSIAKGIGRALKKRGGQYEDGTHGLKVDLGSLSRILTRHGDDEHFVNYLEFWRELDSEYDIRPFFERHRDMIAKGLADNAANEKVLPKYLWMADYHNTYMAKAQPKDTDLLVK